MNPSVINRMIENGESFSAKIAIGKNSYNDTIFDNNILIGSAYVVQDSILVMNYNGEEELSGIQLYVTGEISNKIPVNSTISVLGRENQKLIRNATYRGPMNNLDVGVLFLP